MSFLGPWSPTADPGPLGHDSSMMRMEWEGRGSSAWFLKEFSRPVNMQDPVGMWTLLPSSQCPRTSGVRLYPSGGLFLLPTTLALASKNTVRIRSRSGRFLLEGQWSFCPSAQFLSGTAYSSLCPLCWFTWQVYLISQRWVKVQLVLRVN